MDGESFMQPAKMVPKLLAKVRIVDLWSDLIQHGRTYESIDIGFDQKEAGKRGLTPKVFDQ